MSALGKKRKEDALKPLSEKEIQERLYGRYRSVRPESDGSHAEEQGIADLFSPPKESSVSNPRENFRERPLEKTAGRRREAPAHRGLVFKPGFETWKPYIFQAAAKTRQFFFVIGIGVVKLAEFLAAQWPRIRPGRWRAVWERIPLSLVAVSFFSAVLMVVVFRTAVRWFSAIPAREIIAKVDSLLPSPQATPKPSPEAVAVGARSPVRAGTSGTTVPRKFFTVQLVVYNNAVPAQQLVARLKAMNLDAFFKERVSNGRTFYEVFAGRFKSGEEAERARDRYRTMESLSPFGDSFVRVQME